MNEFTGAYDSREADLPTLHRIYLNIRVRGFPLRDILSLRALRDGVGQGRKIVGASPPPPSPPSPSASFLQVLFFEGKVLKIKV